MPVGHQVTVDVQARCAAVSQRACHQVSIRCPQLDEKTDQRCLRIVAAGSAPQASTTEPSPLGESVLTLSAASARTVATENSETESALKIIIGSRPASVLVGAPVELVFHLQNLQDRSDQDVAVSLQLSEAFRFDQLVSGPVSHATSTENGTVVSFEPIRALRPQETVTFRIRLRTRQSGMGNLSVQVHSRRENQPVTASTSLVIQ